MNTKDYFLKIVAEEAPIFERVIAAIPDEHADYKPDPKSKTALQLARTIAFEVSVLPGVAKNGILDFSTTEMLPESAGKAEVVSTISAGLTALQSEVQALSEAMWDNDHAEMRASMGKWETTKGDMLWHLLLDLIHHRGQLSTYLRAMGGKVPSIYGPSADSAGG